MTLKEIIHRAVERTMAMGVPASQSRLAQQMGVARATISLWMLGRAFPNADHVHKLAELAGVSVEEAVDALWQAKRGQWQRRYRRPDVTLYGPRKGPAKARRHVSRSTHHQAVCGAVALLWLLLAGCHASTAGPSLWTVQYEAAPIPVGPEVRCGAATCWSQGITQVHGLTDTQTRTIRVWRDAPPSVLAWEWCNATRYDATGRLEDRGCPP